MAQDIDFAALEAAAKEAEAEASAAALTEEEAAKHALLQRIAEAKGKRFEQERARREVDAGQREIAAQAAAKGRYLVRALDVVSFFPPGTAPSADRLPTGGVIVVRSATVDAHKQFVADQEAKRKTADVMLVDLLLASIVDPAASDEAAAILRPFFEAFPGAGANAGNVVLELGGLRTAQDKRGRV